MIACLSNLIGIRRPCGDTPASDSGIYLQDLPYINIKTADAILTDQQSGLDLLQQKLNFATENLQNDFVSKLFPRFAQNSVIENQTAGYYQNNMPLNSGIPSTLKGIQLKVMQYPYLSLFLSSVSIFVNHTGQVPIYVYDLIQGKQLDVINVDAVAGEIVQVDIFKKYSTNGQTLNIFIGYDSTGIDSYNSYIFSQGYPGCRACPSYRSYGNRYVWMYSKSIPTTAQKIETNLNSLNDTGGISIMYSLTCTIDRFLCSIKNTLAMPLLYRTAVEILREVKTSSRINSLVVLKKEEVDDLIEWYDGEYHKTLSTVLQNLSLPKDICFTCNRAIRTGVIAP